MLAEEDGQLRLAVSPRVASVLMACDRSIEILHNKLRVIQHHTAELEDTVGEEIF